jgi:aspartate/methionine/tyrosine aminotransferase
MRIREFELERGQSLYEHHVDYNLAESGVHPIRTADLLDPADIEPFLQIRLGYAQTNGPLRLRQRVAEHLGAATDNVLITSGTIDANFISSWHLLEPEDEIAYMIPNYFQVNGLAESFGTTVRTFSLREELGWQPDLDELAEIVGPQTKLIALVNPNNPTGAILTPDSMARIVEIASDAGAWLLVDEIYRGTEHDGTMCPSFWGMYDRVVVTGSLSKAYGLPGLRIGWVIAPPDLAEAIWARKDYTSITAASLSYELAIRALEPQVARRLLSSNRERVLASLAVLRTWAASNERLSLVAPRAAAMALVRYSHEISSVELTDRLREEQSVLVVPGSHFGIEGTLRIGYGVPSEDLEAALGRITVLLDGLP